MPDRGAIKVTVVGSTDVGKVREHNEDSLLVTDLNDGKRLASGQAISRELGVKGILAAVADGMGGAASGELASAMAVEALYAEIRKRSFEEGKVGPAEMSGALTGALTAANTEIHDRAEAEAEHRGMGTTMTAAFLLGKDLAIAQVGDSRAYLIRKGKLVQVTKDQSLIAQLVREGQLTEEEAKNMGGQNIILQALGVEPEVVVDVKTLEILSGDVLILCSDGLSGMVGDEDIQRTVLEGKDLAGTCSRLIALANENGGRDNISVVLARFSGPGLREPLQPFEEGESAEAGPATRFAAPPPPPEEKTGASRGIRLATAGGILVVLVLVLVLVLTGRKADLTLVFPAAGAKGTLKPVGFDASKVAIEPGPGQTRVTLPDLSPGKWRLTATLDHYYPFELEFDVGRGASTRPVGMVGKPGRFAVTPGTPGVTVTFTHDDWKEAVPFSSTDPQTIDHVPAGAIQVSQERTGFRSESHVVTMPPEGGKATPIPLDLKPLEPILVTASFVVEPDLAGARVEIRDSVTGKVLLKGSLDSKGAISGRVRAGTHTLVVSGSPKYQDFKGEITIGEDGKAKLSLPYLVRKKGRLDVKAPPGTAILIRPASEESRLVDSKPVGADGKATFQLPPGKYKVELSGKEHTVPKVVTIEAERVTNVEFPR